MGNNPPNIKTSLPIWGIILSLLGSVPFLLFFYKQLFGPYPIKHGNSIEVNYYLIAVVNAVIGWFYGKKLEKVLIMDLVGDNRKGVKRGLKLGAICGLWIGLATGTVIFFLVIGPVVGMIIGVIFGTIFGGIAGAVFAPIIKKKIESSTEIVS